jgi:hypothetical protein
MDLKREHFCHRWKSLEKWAERAKVLLCHNGRRLIGACLIRLQMKDETDWENNKKEKIALRFGSSQFLTVFFARK